MPRYSEFGYVRPNRPMTLAGPRAGMQPGDVRRVKTDTKVVIVEDHGDTLRVAFELVDWTVAAADVWGTYRWEGGAMVNTRRESGGTGR